MTAMKNANKRKLRMTGLAAVSAALVTTLPAAAHATAATTTPSSSAWRTYPVPVSGEATFSSVVAPSRDDAWAGGFTIGPTGFAPVMLHWNGRGWTKASVPTTSRIDELSATGAKDVWAMTDDQPLHWNGTRWATVTLATVPNMNQGGALAADGPRDAWYLGGTFDPETGNAENLIEEWNGRAWQILSLPKALADGAGLAAIAADGPDDVWVAGTATAATGALVLAHWNGHTWTILPAPSTGFAYTNLSALVVAGPKDAWLAGWGETQVTKGGADRVSLILHWNGKKWALTPTPAGDGELDNIAVGAGGPWAVGDTYHESGLPYTAYVLRWTGTRWTKVAVPTVGDASISAVAAIPGGGVWAVGDTANDSSETPDLTPLIAQHTGR
ncbi:hypothetical protein KDL01_23535 [Actinospica durhamensis]|uniref:Secreted protein n=1 Tax=Actinospica durhamensis TaxID=1508375 RepID=A0A941EPT1_9ACTN|nr:hypothetical protein [Actinospica durhamensis]MBR7836270.1 hypothetical protein [Actinospica durhamensis]